jgi:membrane-bound lytic murein transglycosylase A
MQRRQVSGGGSALSFFFSSARSSPCLRPENIVHHTMKTSTASAARASSNNKAMGRLPSFACAAARMVKIIVAGCVLASCTSVPLPPASESAPAASSPPAAGGVRGGPLPSALAQGKSRWVPVGWDELPGLGDDRLYEAWNAWIKNCERPGAALAPLCGEVRQLSIASGGEQLAWMQARLQPYRIESMQGDASGLLTSYFEPLLKASRRPTTAGDVPLYRAPAGLGNRKPWFSRQEIDTLPEAQAALKGREIAWLADPIDVLMLHIQGSGRLSLQEADGSQRVVRVAFAGSNDQPYRSVNQWLLGQGVTRITPWPDATKAWAAQNPQRVQQLLWSNPRYIFFREEALSDLDAAFGPRGAQGVALTAGRSIAVDPASIPYGTPVWLASRGPAASLQKLVFAQDTGSAITGAVRADYFAGTGIEAGEFAGRVNQPLRMWALWPK